MLNARKPLTELGVLNNFMFNRLSTDPDTKERFCRLMIKGLLNMELGNVNIDAESIILPDAPDKRGIRLDVKIDHVNDTGEILQRYDLEPHREKEQQYPKLSRYRQALLDKDVIPSGSKDYSKLPELYIINVTDYDPFGYGRMVYTIKSICIEEPELCYNDGVTIIYFNTKGTKGGSKELKDFLNYLENSETRNAVNEITAELDSYVNVIRRKSEGDYMTFGDWIDGMFAELIEEKDNELAEKDKALQESEKQLKEANITAVVNMLKLGVDEASVKDLYPTEFEEGKKRYQEQNK